MGTSIPLPCIEVCRNDDSDTENDKCMQLCSRRRFQHGVCIPIPTNIICCCTYKRGIEIQEEGQVEPEIQRPLQDLK